jgi:acyl carrier protein
LREELSFDELALTELALWLEHRFEIEIYDDDLEQFNTVQEIVDNIHPRIQLLN